MRYSKEHKTNTRRRILASAYRLFAAQGFEATSIEAIMLDCNLTRGGFYAHFRSKSQLYHDAINHAALQGELSRQRSDPADANNRIESMLGDYLDSDTTTHNSGVSRLAFFANDVASDEPEVRTAYTNAFKSLSEEVQSIATAQSRCNEGSILSVTAMIIGALAVAQTTDDSALKTKLLASCKENAKALIDDEREPKPLSFFWAPVESSRKG